MVAIVPRVTVCPGGWMWRFFSLSYVFVRSLSFPKDLIHVR
jgi:hypothetical protein